MLASQIKIGKIIKSLGYTNSERKYIIYGLYYYFVFLKAILLNLENKGYS